MNRIIFFLLCSSLLIGCTSQLDKEKQIVMEILKQAGDTDLKFEDVAKVENGRVVELKIRGGSVKLIPNSLCRLSGLHKLEFFHSEVTALPDSIGELLGLCALEVTNAFKEELFQRPLPASLSKLTNLEELGFVNCGLNDLPKDFHYLVLLKELYLANNKFTKIPQDVYVLGNLKYLVLANNEISTLDTAIGNLTNLEYLNLDNNKLVTIPEQFGNLRKLAELSINENQLTDLPNSIVQLTNLDPVGNKLGVALKLNANKLCHLSQEKIAWVKKYATDDWGMGSQECN
jgi:Leucine-rich repeat (LRR) protein